MKTPRTVKSAPEMDLEARKQSIAYQLWEDEGRPDGKAEEHWAQACLVVMTTSDDESGPAPIWLKRDHAVTEAEATAETASEQPATVENINKRSTTRHAA
jgi:Protein of unknown function (DUF2934)